MAKEHTSRLTKKYVSAANQPSSKPTKATSTGSPYQSKQITRLSHIIAGISAVGAALLAAGSPDLAQLMEYQVHTLFYQLRGQVRSPKDIVILAIDDSSISVPEQYYRTDPQQYAFLKPIKAFPYQRLAYAQVIEKLLIAGARSVAVGVLFDTPSSYGLVDDQRLQQTLQLYGSQVTLAAVYEKFETHQGSFLQLTQPQQMFRTGSVLVGSVNLPLEIDGKVHKLATEFSKLTTEDNDLAGKILSFDEATLRASQINYPPPKGNHIHFYGPAGTFEQIPFWYVLDPESWHNYLQQGAVFKDKIVLIGATSQLSKDYHSVAVANNWLFPEKMSGVEIHANAIATLMEGKAIAEMIPSPQGKGLFVLSLVSICAVVIVKKTQGLHRLFSSFALAGIWTGISYIFFVYGQFILPTAVPTVAIVAIGLSYLGIEVTRAMLRKSQLVDLFQKYSSHRVVQEMISQQDDLKDLLQQREMAISGKILDGRYKIVKVLGSGGFSETYIAEDTKVPGNALCVVKQLKPAHNKSEQLAISRRLFDSEAQTLQKLGVHSQIPQLLAYFEEEEEFYLVQEYIIGHALNQEMPTGKRIPAIKVVEMLQDILQTLVFVHQNGVIHRDIKPSNIIRRDSDQKLVLIDFGAVKEVTTQLFQNQEQTAFTIGIGTKGYAPSEQCFGRPRYNSDIYAVGMIGIKALTGIAPHELERDAEGELKWVDKIDACDGLVKILNKMVQEDFQQRYQSALEVLEALNELVFSEVENTLSEAYLPEEITSTSTLFIENSDKLDSTTPWLETPEENIQPPSSTSVFPPNP